MDESYYYPKLELTGNEKKMPPARFFDEIRLLRLPILHKGIIDRGPMKVEDAIPVERWLDALQPVGYHKVQLGYCMLPDGRGYYVEYYVTPADAPTQKNTEMNGCRFRAAREAIGHDEGYHLVLRMSRPCPQGGVEHLNRE